MCTELSVGHTHPVSPDNFQNFLAPAQDIGIEWEQADEHTAYGHSSETLAYLLHADSISFFVLLVLEGYTASSLCSCYFEVFFFDGTANVLESSGGSVPEAAASHAYSFLCQSKHSVTCTTMFRKAEGGYQGIIKVYFFFLRLLRWRFEGITLFGYFFLSCCGQKSGGGGGA